MPSNAHWSSYRPRVDDMIKFTYFGKRRELMVYIVGTRNNLLWADGWEGDHFRSFLVSEMRDVVGSLS
jgi:hypothetical protein